MRETSHWYDGAFYDRLIAPNQDPLFGVILQLIRPGETVLDVGCATGRLVFRLAPVAGSVTGCDPSPRNIRRAERKWERNGKPGNVRFRHGAVRDLSPNDRFDVAVLSFVLHEVDERERIDLLRDTAYRARRVILADFKVPRAPGLMNAASEVVEFFAGPEHYRGFRSFVRNRGLPGLLAESGLVVEERARHVPLPAEICVVRGTGNDER